VMRSIRAWLKACRAIRFAVKNAAQQTGLISRR
jgi:hypothetical protein